MALYGAKTLSVVAGVKSGVKSVKDLKGRKVGSQLGSATDFVFQNKILPKFGLSKSDVQMINVTFQNHVSALVAGSIDAFAGVEPFPSVAEVEKIGKVLVDYSDFDLQPIILAANKSVDRRQARCGGRLPARLARRREGISTIIATWPRKSCSSTSRTRASRSTTRSSS